MFKTFLGGFGCGDFDDAEQWLGTVPSVVWGGAATIAVVMLIGALPGSLRPWRNEPVGQEVASNSV